MEKLDEVFKTVQNECNSIPKYGIELSKDFQNRFTEYIRTPGSSGGYSDVVFDRGVVVLSSNNNKTSYVPTVGFAYAKALVPYLKLLSEYRDVAYRALGESYISGGQGKTLIAALKDNALPQAAREKLKQYGLSDQDQIQVASFLTNYESWGGGKTIDRNDFYISPLMKCAGLQAESQSAIAELSKVLCDNPDLSSHLTYTIIDISKDGIYKEQPIVGEKDTSKIGENVILYGVPGAGKSWTVQQEYCADEKRIERVVFHPDYTYSDFIGQIIPKTKDGRIVYKFSPGPFTKILQKAIRNKTEHYYLIIEEINRGNAPAIFGDIFQLLDRAKEDMPHCCKGSSIYGITNPEIAKCIYFSDEAESDDNEDEEAENIPIRIPCNLSIIATMNTADQNVFTLDTAFQRRWRMRIIENDLESDRHSNILGTTIADTNLCWKKFLKTINEIILNANSELNSHEDKRLGIYFVAKEDLSSVSSWAEKVMKYLWDDAFKFNRDILFDTTLCPTLESVIKTFEKRVSQDRFSVFQAEVRNSLLEDDNKQEL
jgi:hypothetical protein